MLTQKIKQLQAILEHPLLIKKKENLFYLTGFVFDHRAEEYLLVKKNDAVGFGSGLEHIGWIKKADRLKNLGQYLKGVRQLDIEYGFTYGEGEYLKHKLPGVKVKPVRSAVDMMRQVKDETEIVLVKKSMQIVEQVFGQVRREIKKPGMTEIRLAKFIEAAGLKLGAEDISFPAIVASGPNAAIPHHVPSGKRLKAGESIIIDFGFKYKQYCSDFTRTVFLKTAPKKLAEAYQQVEKAHNESIDFVSSRMHLRDSLNLQKKATSHDKMITAGDVYQKSVDVLKEKRLDKFFIHSLGHGTGLEIHELPNLSPASKDIMHDGMVFSIEPGVYFPKVGGIRIEDLVYLHKEKVKKFIKVATKLAGNIF